MAVSRRKSSYNKTGFSEHTQIFKGFDYSALSPCSQKEFCIIQARTIIFTVFNKSHALTYSTVNDLLLMLIKCEMKICEYRDNAD